MKIFRFILIIPVAIVVWYLTFAAGLFSIELAVKHFCKDGSGLVCYDSGWLVIQDTLKILFTGVSAALIVLSAVLMAPDRKLNVCISIYCLGVIVALIFALTMKNAWGPFASAVILGAFSLYFVMRYLTKNARAKKHSRDMSL